jgi:hypothetical protein
MERLDLRSIIRSGVGRDLICNNLKGNRPNKRLYFKIKVFPDATMKSDDDPDAFEEDIVLVTPIQYDLLIRTHHKVLELRLEQIKANYYFKRDDGFEVFFYCIHSSLTVKEGYAEWEVIFY